MVGPNDILVSDVVVSDPSRIRRVLAGGIEETFLRHASDGATPRVVRLVVPLEPCDPFSWLDAQRMMPRIYWHGRDDETRTAALGAADRCFGGPNAGYDALRSQLDVVLPHSDSHVRYFGGFRFDADVEPGGEWKSFGTFTFVLPRFEVTAGHGQAVLACNVLLPHDLDRKQAVFDELDGLSFPGHELEVAVPIPVSRLDLPDRSGWDANVAWALRAFRKGSIEKVVLARRSHFRFDRPLGPLALLKRLEETASNAFVFGFQFEPDVAFVGATPERLFRRRGRRIWTEAVAGTRPRGETPEDDLRFMRELLGSEKDQREHAYVRESIREALTPLCDGFFIEPVASEMKLARGWHLISRSRAALKDGIHGSDVMRALHPTPAVGGHPTKLAVETIRNLEPFDRGWYTGPIGWIGARGAEFAVALRCGLVRSYELALFSGAGIVDGSDPGEEWDEIEQKIDDFVRMFGLGTRAGHLTSGA